MGQTLYEGFESYLATASANAAGTQTTTTLQDTTKTWTANAYAGMYVAIVSGTGAGQQRTVSSNTTTTLTVSSAWTTTPDATSVYRIGQNPTGWATHLAAYNWVADITNPVTGVRSMGLPGIVQGSSGATNNPSIRTASSSQSDGVTQHSQAIGFSGTAGNFVGHVARSDSSSTTYLYAYPNYASSPATVQLNHVNVAFASSPTLSLGVTFTSGQTVVSKFEQQVATTSYGTMIQCRFKAWNASGTEPTNFQAFWNHFGISIANPGNGSYLPGPSITIPSPGGGTAYSLYGNIVGGALSAILIGASGYGFAPSTTFPVSISGGGLTGATGTVTSDAYGCLCNSAVTAGGGSAGNNSPVVTVSGTATTLPTVILGVDSTGYVRAGAITNGGSNVTVISSYSIASTGTGSGAAVVAVADPTTRVVGPVMGGYRGVIGSQGTAKYADPYFDNYYEGTVGTTFGGGQAIAPNATGVSYSPANWAVSGTQAVAVNMGAYVAFSFSGTSLLGNFAQNEAGVVIGYSVDGGAAQTVTLPNGVSTTAFASSLTAGTHTFSMWYETAPLTGDRWNTPVEAVIVTGFAIDVSATITAPTLRTKTAFFFGDSITEGMLDGLLGQNSHLYGWARKVARFLGAEYGMVAFGGSGLNGTNSANVPGFATGTSWQSVYNGVSRMSGSVFAVQPDYVFLAHGVNGTWYSADLVAALVGLRTSAPNAWIFQLIPFAQQSKKLMVGTSLTGAVASATSTTLVINTALPQIAGVLGQYLTVTAVAPNGTQQSRSITGSGPSVTGGTTTIPITAAWTTMPDSTYTFFLESAIENYRRLYPADAKLIQLNCGTEYAKGIPGSGGPTMQSTDGLHPSILLAGDLSAPVSVLAYSAMNPATGGGAFSFA